MNTRNATAQVARIAATLALSLVVTLSIFTGVSGLSAPSHAGAHLAQVHAEAAERS